MKEKRNWKFWKVNDYSKLKNKGKNKLYINIYNFINMSVYSNIEPYNYDKVRTDLNYCAGVIDQLNDANKDLVKQIENINKQIASLNEQNKKLNENLENTKKELFETKTSIESNILGLREELKKVWEKLNELLFYISTKITKVCKNFVRSIYSPQTEERKRIEN